MKRFPSLFLLFALALTASAQSPKDTTRFPVQVYPIIPKAVSKLNAEELYVIDSDIPILVFASPQGLVNITEETGPLRIRARFVDGTKMESRTIKGKYIVLVEAIASGNVELIVVPAGATKAADAIRKQLEVDAGQGPRPPPTPTTVTHLTFVWATQVDLSVVNDSELRDWLRIRGVKAHVYAANDNELVKRGLAPAVSKAGGSPAIVMQDQDGNVVGQSRLTTVAAVKELVLKHTGK